MQKIAFFGLGNMGTGMAYNLLNAGIDISVFDLVKENMDVLSAAGAKAAMSPQDAVADVDVVITMLPASKHVESLLLGDHGLIHHVPKNTLFIDCSTIEASAAQALAKTMQSAGHRFVDAPVSGGVAGASAGTLTFICGGTVDDIDEARPLLQKMGQNIFHAGDVGAGQIAKICNNMLLAVLMTATSESLQMAIDNGLDPKVMSQIMQKSSGNNWTLEKYNPCPEVMPDVPSSKQYQGGFMVDLMNKDLGLAMQTASEHNSSTPMGALARTLYQLHAKRGKGHLDFSSIFQLFAEK